MACTREDYTMIGVVNKKILPHYFFLGLFVLSLTIYLSGLYRVKSIFWGDSLYYYAYTRSIVVDHDLELANQAEHKTLGYPNPIEISEITGKVTNKFSPGTSLLWIPAFTLGQSLVVGTNWITGTTVFDPTGNSLIPQLFVAVSALTMSIVGFWFIYRTIFLWFSESTALKVVGILYCTTQLFYYTALDPVNSHSASFLLSSALVYYFSQIIQKQIYDGVQRKQFSWQPILRLGGLAGLLLLVRNQDVVVVLPLLAGLLFWEKRSLLIQVNTSILFLGSAFLIFSVQLFFTVNLFGLLASPYFIRGEQMLWMNPDFSRILFTLENGIFFFAPILGIALFFLATYVAQSYSSIKKVLQSKSQQRSKKVQFFSLCILAQCVFFFQAYIIACWAPEIIGGPYGSRMFLSTIPFLSIGLALMIDWLQDKVKSHTDAIYFWIGVMILFFNMLAQTLWMLYRF